jgi:hypothetical protein
LFRILFLLLLLILLVLLLRHFPSVPIQESL